MARPCGFSSTIGRRCASAQASANMRTSWPSALARSLAPADTLTLFSSSWKDRLAPDVVPGTPMVDARVPVRVLNFAWHRLELAARRMVRRRRRRRALDAPAAACRRAGRRRSSPSTTSYFLDHAGAHAGRDPPRLRRARRAPTPAARRRGGRRLRVHRRRRSRSRFDVPRASIVICSPGAPRWRPRDRTPRAGPILFMGTLEPRKNVGAAARRLRRGCSRRSPMRRRSTLAGKLTPACEPMAARAAEAAARRPRHAPRLRQRRRARAALSGAPRCSCCRRSTKGSACRRSKR